MDKVKKQISYPQDLIDRKVYTGKGVRIAVLDTGIMEHPDMQHRIIDFYDCTNNRRKPYDDNGHGTHVSGILAGDGKKSNGILAGIAPESELIGVKVLDRAGEGKVEYILKGLQWVKENWEKYQIRIVNISVGAKAGMESEKEECLIRAVESLWDIGLIVVVSAGNLGPGTGTVTVPGTSRKVITVGAIEAGGKEAEYSGNGPTEDCIVKPDILAPGYRIISCSHNFEKDGSYYVVKSGTSMATPVVSGAIALLLSKYPDLTNVETKLWLRDCADAVKNRQYCGFGTVNVAKILNKK